MDFKNSFTQLTGLKKLISYYKNLGTFSKNFSYDIFILSQTAQLDTQIYLIMSVLCTRKEKFEIERCAV